MRYASAAIEKDLEFTDACALAVPTYLAAMPLGYGAALSGYSDRLERWVATADGLKNKNPFLEIGISVTKFRADHIEVALSGILAHALQRAPYDVMTLVFACWSYVWLGCFKMRWTARKNPSPLPAHISGHCLQSPEARSPTSCCGDMGKRLKWQIWGLSKAKTI